MDVARSALQGAHFHLLASLTGEKEWSKCLMVLYVKLGINSAPDQQSL